MPVKKPPKKLIKICKRLKIKLTRKSKSGKRVYKSVKQLLKDIKKRNNFIKKVNARSVKRGAVGAFRKWCKSKKLTNKSGKVTMKCIKRGLKDKNVTIRRRANYARNIGGYSRTSFGLEKPRRTKLTSFGPEKPRRGLSFGLDQQRYENYATAGWNVPKTDFSKNMWKRVRRNCEDGRSGILDNEIIPGMYVNLGHKKCLSVQEIIKMYHTNRFIKDSNGNILNPYTRQPLTRKQLIKLNAIIDAEKRFLNIQNSVDLLEYDQIDDLYEYSNYLRQLLLDPTTTIPDQKRIIPLFGRINYNVSFEILPQDENIKWRLNNGRINLLTPDGYLLPEQMDQDNWWNVGSSIREDS